MTDNGPMLDLLHWPVAQQRALRGVFTDIDDTLTTHGQITSDALLALTRLKAAGLSVIPITGRPVGWCEPFASAWPVDAIVAENGAVAWVNGCKHYQQDEATRLRNRQRMQAVMQGILREMPHACMAADSVGRETDIAVDHSEFHHLNHSDRARVAAIMQSQGMTATISSIHINGWFGEHNKLNGARWIVRELFDRVLDDEIQQWAYVGDSSNDALMFAHFPHSVGVANVREFECTLTHLPRYVTPSMRGAGFAEFARWVLLAIC